MNTLQILNKNEVSYLVGKDWEMKLADNWDSIVGLRAERI